MNDWRSLVDSNEVFIQMVDWSLGTLEWSKFETRHGCLICHTKNAKNDNF